MYILNHLKEVKKLQQEVENQKKRRLVEKEMYQVEIALLQVHIRFVNVLELNG
jgi:hypothetical protein